MARPAHLVFASNSAWNLAHFRGSLIQSFTQSGARVTCIVPFGDDASMLGELGAAVERVRLSRSGTSLIADLRLTQAYSRILWRLKPDAFLGFTAKPNIYGSVAAWLAGVPTINNISGLGTGFLSGSWLERTMVLLYRIALRHSTVVFFQNDDDRNLFLERGVVRPEQVRSIAGSGVDLNRFRPAQPVPRNGEVHFLLVARMLRDKGVREFVEAAGIVGSSKARFSLLGPAGDDNRTAIDRRELEDWTDEGVVCWLGPTGDVRPAMLDADVIVLPSYREGMPRTLIEAAALGKPVIASDVPGCRQAVVEGVTGLLCSARDAGSLADAMRRMLDSDRLEMGAANRARAEREFGVEAIISAYREALSACGVQLGG